MFTCSKDSRQFKPSIIEAVFEEIRMILVVDQICIPDLDNSRYFIIMYIIGSLTCVSN